MKNVTNKKRYTWIIAVLPFVAAEIATGVISGLTGFLSIPPLYGPGTVVDVSILVLGLLTYLVMFKKSGEKQNP